MQILFARQILFVFNLFFHLLELSCFFVVTVHSSPLSAFCCNLWISAPLMSVNQLISEWQQVRLVAFALQPPSLARIHLAKFLCLALQSSDHLGQGLMALFKSRQHHFFRMSRSFLQNHINLLQKHCLKQVTAILCLACQLI